MTQMEIGAQCARYGKMKQHGIDTSGGINGFSVMIFTLTSFIFYYVDFILEILT